MPARRPVAKIGLPVIVLLSLAACGGGASKPAASSASAATAPKTSASAPSVSSSKADFLTKMNAVCAADSAKLAALKQPTGPTDYAGISTALAGSLAVFGGFIAESKVLVEQSPDAAELKAKWLSLDESDFNVTGPLVTRLITASKAKQGALVTQLLQKLNAAPDHTTAVSAFMKTYGLTRCATLETA
jgi:hypothetical protein